MKVIIKHRRAPSAIGSAKYLRKIKEKLAGLDSVAYMTREKKWQGDCPGERVKKYWAGGFTATGDAAKDAALLMWDLNVEGRAEVVEFIVSIGAEPGEVVDRDVADALAVEVTQKLFAKFFPGRRYLGALHGDTDNSHCHASLGNQGENGLSVQIPDPVFLEMRRDCHEWVGAHAKSSWGSAKACERALAKLTREEAEEEVKAGRLTVHRRNRKTGEVDRLAWVRPGKKKGRTRTCADICRWWNTARVQGLDWGLCEISLEASIWHHKHDLATSRARAMVALVEREQAAALRPTELEDAGEIRTKVLVR